MDPVTFRRLLDDAPLLGHSVGRPVREVIAAAEAAATNTTPDDRRPLWLGSGRMMHRGHRPIVAVSLAIAIVMVAVITGVFFHEIGARLAGTESFGWPALTAGRWWSVVTSLLLTRNWFMAVTMPIAVAGALGAYEYRAGSVRALVVAAIGHISGSVVVAVGAGIAGTTGDATLVRAAQNLDYGASMIVAAALGALASRSHSRRFRWMCAFGVVLLVPLHHQMADWAHLVAMPTGYLIDRARRPRARAVGLATACMATAWLTVTGPGIVGAAADAVRFHEFTTQPPTTVVETRNVEHDEPRIFHLTYLARALNDRPEVATVLVPLHAVGPLHVAVFFHGVPGSPGDWLVGGHLDELLVQPAFANTITVLADSPGYHDPRAGWYDVPGQRTITSLREDLLPAIATRWSIDQRPRSIAVVSVGRGAGGAVTLARTDRRIGWLAAIDPAVDIPPLTTAQRNVVTTPLRQARLHMSPAARRRQLVNAQQRWSAWSAALPGTLDWLSQHGFGDPVT